MDVLDALLGLWNSSPDSVATGGRYTRSALKAPEVVVRLRRNFPETRIVEEISRFLAEMAALMESDGIPDRRDIFLCSCCLTLISDPDGVRVPLSLVQNLVRSFPISIWYRSMTRVVASYLSRADLLAALIRGLSVDAPPVVIENCLQGVRMYAKFALHKDDPAHLDSLKRQIAPLIEGYVSDPRSDIVRYAQRAKAALGVYVA